MPLPAFIHAQLFLQSAVPTASTQQDGKPTIPPIGTARQNTGTANAPATPLGAQAARASPMIDVQAGAQAASSNAANASRPGSVPQTPVQGLTNISLPGGVAGSQQQPAPPSQLPGQQTASHTPQTNASGVTGMAGGRSPPSADTPSQAPQANLPTPPLGSGQSNAVVHHAAGPFGPFGHSALPFCVR